MTASWPAGARIVWDEDMTRLTLQDLLERMEAVLLGQAEFPALREWVFDYYCAELDLELDEHLEAIFPVLLPYLHYEESQGDPGRETRLRRVLLLLHDDLNSIKERVVFALEFDRACELARKVAAGVIPNSVYEEQLAKLSPADYDSQLVGNWARRHAGEGGPIPGRIK